MTTDNKGAMTEQPELFGKLVPTGAMMWFASHDERGDDLVQITHNGQWIARSIGLSEANIAALDAIPPTSFPGAVRETSHCINCGLNADPKCACSRG